MVSLARPITGDRILAQHVFNTTALLAGDAGYGQTVRLVQMSDPTTYANFLGNADATNGLAVQVQYGASSSPTILAQMSKARVYVNQGLVSGQVDRAAPGTTLSAVYPRTSDGRWSSRIGAAGTENPFAYLSESSVGAIASAGDLLYGTGAAAITNLPIGTARQMLTVNAGATAPVWAPSPLSVLTTTGDLLYASAANTQARLGIGATNSMLTVSGTLPAWTASPVSLMTATGDILYASAANTPARLAAGTNGQVLTLAGGIPSWANAGGRNGAASAVGATSSPTTASTAYADLPDMTATLTTSGGDLLCWFAGSAFNSGGNNNFFAFSLDGAAEVGEQTIVSTVLAPAHAMYRFSGVSGASHTVKVRWKVSAGTMTAFQTYRNLVVMET